MFRIETWICTTLFAVGIIFGMTYLNLSGYTLTGASVSSPTEPLTNSRLEESTELVSDDLKKKYGAEISQPNVDLQNETIQRADLYLIAGNYSSALEGYYDFEKSTGNSGSAILLRQAYCCEMQSRFSLAEEKFYRGLTEATSESHRVLGFAGLARCLAKNGKQAEALEMLAEQNLKLDQFVGIPEEARAQLVYQYAKLLESFAIGNDVELTEPGTVAFEDYQPKPQNFLETIDQPATNVAPLVSTAELRFKILQRPGNSLSVISASISAKLESVEILIGQIAAHAQQELFISQLAQSAIVNRARSVELQAAPLSLVLDQLLVPFDLVWFQIDAELHIVSRSEMNPAVSPRQFWFDAADRAHRRFELSFDRDVRRKASLLSRAGLSFIQKRYDVAANQLQELSQTQPDGEIHAKLFFNQAKLDLMLGRVEAANRSLFLAVDQSMNPDIQASGYCLLGANLLSQGELESSIKVSRRGRATAINGKQKRMASLNLSRAYLLNNDPYMANKVLFDNRTSFEDSDASAVASILGTYARFIGTRDKNGILIAQNRLLSAITMVPEEKYQSFADAYVVGLAYERLGFREKALEKLMLSLAQTDVGRWKRQILFELAILQNKLGRPAEALVSFQSVIRKEDDRWNRLAMEQLAKTYLETNQPQLSIDTCKQLWSLPLEETQKQSVLQVLGDAYQLKGEHYTAALCFAGMIPDKF